MYYTYVLCIIIIGSYMDDCMIISFDHINPFYDYIDYNNVHVMEVNPFVHKITTNFNRP